MNAWALTGNLGHDPRLRHLPSGKAILNLHVAVNERDYVDGAWTNVTLWVDVTLFGARAEGLHKLLAKGMRVAARGRAKVREYTGRDGAAKWALELVADDVEPLEPPRRGEQEPRTSRPMPQHPGQLGDPRAHHHRMSETYGGALDDGPQFGGDDDIPF